MKWRGLWTCCAVALALSLAGPVEAKRTKPWKTPPGQVKKGRTAPPGLAKKGGLPPGLAKKSIVGDTSGVRVVTPAGTTYRRGGGRRLTR